MTKSFLSFFRKKRENHGRADDKIKVGVFKGIIEIWNEDDKKQHQREIKECKEDIFRVVAQIYTKIHGKPIPLKIDEIHKSSSH